MKDELYPGGSRNRVNKAGDRVRANTATDDDFEVIDEWRSAHRAVLNTFQALLRNRTRGKKITVAQRHKRKTTIFDKLDRLPKMKLSRMDDVAGCRLIFRTERDLRQFRKDFHKAKFKHARRNEVDKYDYIKNPKGDTGYRGIHDVYEYDVRSTHGQALKGLFVEIQYRTLVQHAWATAVELVGAVTESQPKFKRGDDRYQRAMRCASEILARAFESSKGALPDLSDREVVEQFVLLDRELGLLNTLRSLNAAGTTITAKRNAILMSTEAGDPEVLLFRDATDALTTLFELEKKYPHRDIVLVRADTTDEVRLAFKNYFADARDFIKWLEQGCAKLSGRQRELALVKPSRGN